MDNQTEVKITFKNYVNGEKKLERYRETLSKVNSILSGMDKGMINDLSKSAESIKNIDKETKSVEKNINNAFKYGAIREFTRHAKNLTQEFSALTKSSFDYLENLNLYQVAFDDNTKSADKFINTMTEMYGLDESWLVRNVGIFKQLSNAMNVPIETGNKLSQLLTQMSLDISSLYNVDIERASSVLQSSLAGQTKPIRGLTGGDITQATLQTTLDNLGINRAITDLSFAEKRLLIVISLTDQLSESIGDMGKTIESPSNQMRILNEQWKRFNRAVGNVFLKTLENILPYLNAILMVLTEIINMVATLFGYNEEDYNFLGDTSYSAFELEEGLSGAVASAEKLKRGLRGFDKLNVITTPSSSGASAGAGSGIDPDIMNAFNKAFDEYQSKLDNVEMKATRIRDALMEWLGFTKKIDKETGKVSFKFKKLTSGTVLGALAMGGAIYNGLVAISKLLATIGLISKPLPTIFTIIKTAIVGIASALSISVGWVVAIGAAIAGLVVLVVTYWEEIKTFIVDIGTTVGEFFGNVWNNINEVLIQPILNFFSTLANFVYETTIQPIIVLLSPLVEALTSIFTLIFDNTIEIVGGVTTAIGTIIAKVIEIGLKIIEIFIELGKAGYKYIISPIVDFVVGFAQFLWNYAFKPLFNFLSEIGGWVYEKVISPIWNWIVWMYNNTVETFKDIGTTVVNFVSNLFKNTINGILWTIENTINGFIRMLNTAIDIINKIPEVNITKITELSIPRLQKGMDFVPKDYYGPVYLDYGERVLTKEENRQYNYNKEYSNGNYNIPSSNQTFIIQVGDEEVARVMLDKFSDMAKSNGEPITIG